MKSIIAFLCCFIAVNCVAQKRKSTADRFAGLDTAFTRILKDWKAAGFAIVVVEKNKVIYAKGLIESYAIKSRLNNIKSKGRSFISI